MQFSKTRKDLAIFVTQLVSSSRLSDTFKVVTTYDGRSPLDEPQINFRNLLFRSNGFPLLFFQYFVFFVPFSFFYCPKQKENRFTNLLPTQKKHGHSKKVTKSHHVTTKWLHRKNPTEWLWIHQVPKPRKTIKVSQKMTKLYFQAIWNFNVCFCSLAPPPNTLLLRHLVDIFSENKANSSIHK